MDIRESALLSSDPNITETEMPTLVRNAPEVNTIMVQDNTTQMSNQ